MHFTRAKFGIALVVVGSVLACAEKETRSLGGFHVAREQLRSEALGCWTFRDATGRNVAAYFDWVPPFARLDSAIVYRGDAGPARSIERLDSAGRAMPLGLEPGIKGTNEWLADRQTDTIRLTFNNAFSGSTFFLRLPSSIQDPDTLYGRAYEFSDAGPRETDRGAVVAVRVGCPRMSSSTRDGV